MAESRTLFGHLVEKYSGPILVIGGGPSVPADLVRLEHAGVKPVAVVSANEHGIHQERFEVTYVVTADGVHHEKHRRMDVVVRDLGCSAPIVSGCFFADYRLPDWRMGANTGLQAIAIAVAMGGNPVIVTGLDFFKLYNASAGTYFHDPRAKSSSNVKVYDNFAKQIDALHRKIAGKRSHPVRAMSGPLREIFPSWDESGAPTSRGELPDFARWLLHTDTHLVRAADRSAAWALSGMSVDRNEEVACSPLEAKKAIEARAATLVRILPSPVNLQTSTTRV